MTNGHNQPSMPLMDTPGEASNGVCELRKVAERNGAIAATVANSACRKIEGKRE